VPYVHLEPGEFMTNAGIWSAQIAAGDVVRDGYGSAVNAPIAPADIAAVAARCLLDDGHEGRRLQPQRDGRVRCSARMASVCIML